MQPAIRVEGLGKRYRLAHASGGRGGYKTLRESLTGGVATLANRVRGKLSRDTSEEFWALKDVSFDVQPGEVVGIIGRNGAGKSTLLKILSRITKPTTGRVEINGRVGSLLEVGTGFHPELTGRENIYLNGSILGMSRREIDRKFDEIVAFAEVEKFLDTPVKRYSSGMYVRLAFAVAAHLEPEILIVDEVLAVGDAAFQQKCLGKMEQVARVGRTILFVSHNMAAVTSLCTRVVALEDRRLWADGAHEVIEKYLQLIAHKSDHSLAKRRDVPTSCPIWFTDVSFRGSSGQTIHAAVSGQPLTICLEYDSTGIVARPDFAITIYSPMGECMFYCDTSVAHQDRRQTKLPSKGIVTCTLPNLPLAAGTYRLNLLIHQHGMQLDHVVGATKLVVEDGDFFGTGRQMPTNYPRTLVTQNWTLQDAAERSSTDT